MGENKHTPGPWRLDRTARGAGFSVVAASPKRAGGGNRICTCRPASYSPEAHDEAEANARLIAAAPDLLEALKAIDAAEKAYEGEIEDDEQTLVEDDTSHYPATARKLAANVAATLTSLLERAERAERRAEELADGLMYVTVDHTGCIYTTADEDRAIKLAKDNLVEAERNARERAEARIKELEQALEPFARLGGYIEDATEGFSDSDELDLYLHDFLIHRFKASDFRRAHAALNGGQK